MREPLPPQPPTGDDESPAFGIGPTPQREPQPGSPILRSMTDEDLAFVVDQHLNHFPDGFFARLGSRFLHEYYRAFLTSGQARAMVASIGGHRAGYLVGVIDPAAHREHVIARHGRALAGRGVATLSLHPALGVRFLRSRGILYARKLLRRRRAGTSSSTTRSHDRTAVLAHVAVTLDAQSHGVGSELIGWFLREAAAAGCDRVVLVTASGDDGAGPYYRRRGWHTRGEHRTPDGLHLTTYEHRVGTAQNDREPGRGSAGP